MSSIEKDVLLKPIAVNIAERLLGAACVKKNLIPGDFMLHQKVSKGIGTIKTSK
jgi:hypothetical protein